MAKWGYTKTLGIFELQERDGKHYMPGSFVSVNEYYDSEEEAKVHYYQKITKSYTSEKRELQKRIKKLNQMHTEAKQLFKIDELMKSHPEYFFE